MFGNWREQKPESASAAGRATAGSDADPTRVSRAEDSAAGTSGATPLPTATPAAIRRRNIITPPQTDVAAERPIDRLRQQIPGAPPPTRAETVGGKESQRLVVGGHIHLKGEVTKCDAFIVEGHFEGSATSRAIQVTKDGSFDGDAEAEIAEVSGKFDGNLTVSDKLVIRSTGRVTGSIRYSAIEVEAGGQISGNVQVTVQERPTVPEPAPEPEQKPASRPALQLDATGDTVFAS